MCEERELSLIQKKRDISFFGETLRKSCRRRKHSFRVYGREASVGSSKRNLARGRILF